MELSSGSEIIRQETDYSINAADDDNGASLLADKILATEPPPHISTRCFIYRVPDNLRKGNEDKYEPSIVSIGPYHRNKKDLKITEKHKIWYLRNLISKSQPSNTTSLIDIIKAIKKLEVKARECYAEEIDLSSDDFVMMMVVDGCFIIELLYREGLDRGINKDPLVSAPWIVKKVEKDLILLENQLPFIVLECLFRITRDRKRESSLNRLLGVFFAKIIPKTNLILVGGKLEGSHLLDFLRNSIIPPDFQRECGPAILTNRRGAKELRQSGMIFKTQAWSESKFECLVDVNGRDGILEFYPYDMESLYILIPNLVALEQCFGPYEGYITSYAMLLGYFITSEQDVKVLRRAGIFLGNQAEDEKFAAEISTLYERVHAVEFHYLGLIGQVENYTQTFWRKRRPLLHQWYGILMRDYFTSPWAIVSFIAAVILLLLTAVQTIFAILSYHR
ncbi:hypothetical protein FRX31_022790 [Thalictrum thalictroides]|uniref:Transmembrane protein n=1 Tax=Thalictrum thalictroides TaxID=46969 RepID=A0A7J6VS85_THATH|nr:hypothetical protein FRX31_022790 [Thalictrum thalictroides]